MDPYKLGNDCYVPNTVFSHAFYAFNSYYQISGHALVSCDFNGLATITSEGASKVFLVPVSYLSDTKKRVHDGQLNSTIFTANICFLVEKSMLI